METEHAIPAADGNGDGTIERLVPAEMHGTVVEAEHLARYRWAAALAPGKRVLDAGCGSGYGSRLLADAGATDVVGVDIAADALEAARASVGDTVRLVQGDLAELPFEDGSFDLVVCFEVIEHVDDHERALDELARVLADDGLLVVSSPNRRVYPRGNRFHRHEFLPEELRNALGGRFPYVRLFRQHDWVTTAVVNDAAFLSASEEPIPVDVTKAAEAEPETELYTIALAGSQPLPTPRGVAVLTRAVEVRDWQEQLQRSAHDREEAMHELEQLREVFAEYERQAGEGLLARDEIARLRSAHEMLARRIVAERVAMSDQITALQRHLEMLHRSRSFRYTAPFRAVLGGFKRR